jgi:HAD superfamily hydrolase (TIGR01490 family)
MKLALFDLDHTLLPLDSDHAWGEFTIQLGWHDGAAFRAMNDRFYDQYKMGVLNLAEYIAFTTEGIRRVGKDAALAAHQRFMAEVIQPAITPQALALLQKHRDAGDTLVLITATNEFVTRPIAKALGFEHLLAVELQTDEGGWYNGQIQGVPSFREGKVTRMQNWLAERGSSLPQMERSVFYSDSINDLPLLEQVHTPVATNPDNSLLSIARERDWQVLNLFS